MKRREFIKQGVVGTVGLSLIPIISGCTPKAIDLSTLLNTEGQLLQPYKFLGNQDFGYYKLSNTIFKQNKFKGEEAFVYVKGGKIKGFSIRKEGVNEWAGYVDKLTQDYGNPNLIYDNTFGKRYCWKDKEKEYYLSHTKNIPYLMPYTFYGEAVKDHGLIVF